MNKQISELNNELTLHITDLKGIKDQIKKKKAENAIYKENRSKEESGFGNLIVYEHTDSIVNGLARETMEIKLIINAEEKLIKEKGEIIGKILKFLVDNKASVDAIFIELFNNKFKQSSLEIIKGQNNIFSPKSDVCKTFNSTVFEFTSEVTETWGVDKCINICL